MKISHWYRLFLTLILICALAAGCASEGTGDPSGDPAAPDATAPTLVGTPGDETVDNACYLYTPRMVEDAFLYLDEIYIEKYPELGLRWEHGTGADQRILTAFAQQITEGCTTDKEKVTAIYDWIVDNIRYREMTFPFSHDVLYSGYGNCLGQAMLMQDLCRVLGIPAVYSDGFRGNMKTFSVEAMQNADAGHAWLFVYVDDAWALYDPTWRTSHVTDRDFIAENFFVDHVGGIKPIYDEDNLPPFSDPIGAFCYLNGRFVTKNYNNPGNEFGGSLINFTMSVYAYAHGIEPVGSAGIFYWDGPASFAYAGREPCEIYTSGWIGIGEPAFLWGDVSYAYENGIAASETVMQWRGDTYYFQSGSGRKLCLPDDAYRLIGGGLVVSADYNGKIWEPHENLLPEGEYTYQWFSTNEAVATVDENGYVTCHNAGSADICVLITGTGHHGNEEFPITEENNPMLIRIDGETGEESVDYGFSLSVNFQDDISRPAQYAALDPGGAAYIDYTPVSSSGYEDFYPIMTDDMLMMFDPEDDVITLPTAQNANGYFIMLETYENALTWPYDFNLPLAEGSLILDRNKLKEFTLVNTDLWGEMWYLPLTEEGVDAFGPGTDYQPGDIDFGYAAIPTGELYQNGAWEPYITDAIPENGMISTQLLPVVPELPEPNCTGIHPAELQYAIDQDCALELIIQGNSLILDTAAIQTMLPGGEDDFIMFWFVAMENEWCDYGQQIPLQRMATVGIYNINYYVDGTDIHDLQGGTATVTVPLNETGGEYGAFFVDAYGNLTELPSTVNGDGTITFEAPYFATYAIIDISQTPVN